MYFTLDTWRLVPTQFGNTILLFFVQKEFKVDPLSLYDQGSLFNFFVVTPYPYFTSGVRYGL